MKKIFICGALLVSLLVVFAPSHVAYAATSDKDAAQACINSGWKKDPSPRTTQTCTATVDSTTVITGTKDESGKQTFTKTVLGSPPVPIGGPTQSGSDTTVDQLTFTEKLCLASAVNPAIAAFCAAKDLPGQISRTLIDISASTILTVITTVVYLIVEIAVFILMLIGLLLNSVVQLFVINMGDFVSSQSSSGIQTAWQIIRDLANIGIIGSLVAVAIGTILQNGSINAGKYLVKILLAALLINFSYFFAGAIIDSSNFLATQFYAHLVCGQQTGADCARNGIAGAYQGIINLQAPSDAKSIADSVTRGASLSPSESELLGTGEALKALMGALLLLVLVLVTIFVFLSSVALLIGRFVALVFLLITSPIGIAGSAIPVLSKYTKQWWDAMFAQAFFAPVFFLLMGISITILDSFTNTNAFSSQLSTDTQGGTGDIARLLNFIVATAFMLMSLKIAKSMSDNGKEYLGGIYAGADKLSGWMPKAYTGALKGLGGYAGTQTLGKAGDRLGRAYSSRMSAFKTKYGDRYADKEQREKMKTGEKMLGALSGVFIGGGIDRNIRGAADAVRDAKFGGKTGYKEGLTKKEERLAELTEKGKIEQAKADAPALIARFGSAEKARAALAKQLGDNGAVALVEDELAAKHYNGKKFAKLTKDEKANIMSMPEWKKAHKDATDALGSEDLNALSVEMFNGKSFDQLTNAERKELTKEMVDKKRWKGRKWVKNNGKWGWETGWPLDERLDATDFRSKSEIDKENDKVANSMFGANYATLSPDKKEKVDGEVEKSALSVKMTKDELKKALTDVSVDTLKDEQLRDHNFLAKMTPLLTPNQYDTLLKDTHIDKHVKAAMRMQRLGGKTENGEYVGILGRVQKFEADTVDNRKTWEAMSEKDREGKYLRGSAAYTAERWNLHEQMKKNYAQGEIVEYVESDTGRDSGIRSNRAFNDAVTNFVFTKLQGSEKLSSEEKRFIRADKRSRYEIGIVEDKTANETFDRLNDPTNPSAKANLGTYYQDKIESEEGRDLIMRSIAAKVRYGIDDFEGLDDKRLNDDQREDLRKTPLGHEEYMIAKSDLGTTDEMKDLVEASYLRSRADSAVASYYDGKNADEIASEAKQETMPSRLSGKYMKRDQFLATQGKKDEQWRAQTAEQMAIHGKAEDVFWLRTTPEGQRQNIDWLKVNATRLKLHKPTADALVSEFIAAQKTRESVAQNQPTADKNPVEDTPRANIARIILERAYPTTQLTVPARPAELLDFVNRMPADETVTLFKLLPEDAVTNPVASQEVIRNLRSEQVQAIIEDRTIQPHMKDVVVDTLFDSAQNAGGSIQDTAKHTLETLYKNGHLSGKARTDYERLFPNP